MQLTKRSGERASDVQRSTVAAWYLAACFMVCVVGAVWLASIFGVIDFGGSGSEASKAVAKAAAQKAAAQQLQARLTAEEEARNIAADATRLIKVPVPTPSTDPAASATSSASAASDTPPAPSATKSPAPQ